MQPPAPRTPWRALTAAARAPIFWLGAEAAVAGESQAAIVVSMCIAAIDIVLLALRWLWWVLGRVRHRGAVRGNLGCYLRCQRLTGFGSVWSDSQAAQQRKGLRCFCIG